MKQFIGALCVGVTAIAAVHQPVGAQAPASQPAASTEWPEYGHDPGGQRFSPLTDITPANVGQLKQAWVYRMRPPTPAPAGGAAPDAPAGGRGRGRGGAGFAQSQNTSIVVNNVMYISSPYGRVVALEPTTGKEIWVYQLPVSTPSTRGVSYWPGDAQTPAQIVFGSNNGKLYSLDAKTGLPNPAFGNAGIVELNTAEILQGIAGGNNALTSPPTVYKNLVIVGGRTQENPPTGVAGDVRAWDIHTGRLVWSFRSVPGAGERFNDTWAGESWRNRSGVNVWGPMTLDVPRGILYMPFGAPSVDQYGGDRAGDNLFSTSIVAADANTGKYLWHFQLVHHDIWDADMPAAPALFDVTRDGKTIPAVAAISKVGLVFLLNRVTGEAIYGVEERPVPASEVPLERASKTQPFPMKPGPLSRNSMRPEDVATVTPELEAACRKLMENMQMGGPYLPQSYNRLRVVFPGNHGGMNWGGVAFNPQLGYLIVNTSDLGQVAGLKDRDPANAGPAQGAGVGNRVDPGGPYEGVAGGGRFSVPGSTYQQLPCQQPPWGQLVAIDVNTGEFAWRVTLGVTDSLPEGKQNTGRPGNGGPITTAGGLVFVGATDDARFRAFDARTGKELWTIKLAAVAHATPSTYRGSDGKQYVVITSTGGGFFNAPTSDDSITAFSLP
jgi:quinoprotein glucose dehydrogenase